MVARADAEARARHDGTPPLPASIWVVAWVSLAIQLELLFQRGLRSDDGISVVGSAVLGALLVGYVAAGVVRARTIRLALVWVLLVLAVVVELIELASVYDPGDAAVQLLSLSATVVMLVGLASFRRTDWYAWQRTRPSVDQGAPIGRLLVIAMVVGVLGGLVDQAGDRVDVDSGHRYMPLAPVDPASSPPG